MKWIGQHIWDFISRFRTTVYLENLETSSEENVLVVDSDGKVTKNTTLGGSDVTMTNGVDNRVMTATGAAAITGEQQFTYDASTQLTTLASSTEGFPEFKLQTDNGDTNGPTVKFERIATNADNDILGNIIWKGTDDGGNSSQYATIKGIVADATNTDEAGKLSIEVQTNSTESRQALTATGLGTASKVDIGLGYGTASVTTLAGDLTISGDNIIFEDNMTSTSDGFLKQVHRGIEIENASDSAAPALLIDNDDADQIALDIDAANTTGNIIDIAASSLTTGKLVNFVGTQSGVNSDGFVRLEIAQADTTTNTNTPIYIDFNKTGVLGASQLHTFTGLTVDYDDTATNNAAAVTSVIGADLILTNSNDTGTLTQTGLSIRLEGGDPATTTGILIDTPNDAIDFKVRSEASGVDLFTIDTKDDGETTLTTVESGGGSTAHMNLVADGNITLDSANLIYIDSATLGYIGLNVGGTTYGSFQAHSGESKLVLYENQGASTSDYYEVAVAANGATTIKTVDGGGSDANLQITADGTAELAGTTVTLDASANIELNADGGDVVFKDDSAFLAKINSDGLSFVDNTGAGIIFEGTTDDAYNTTLTAADTTSSNKTITLPDATGTVALQNKHLQVVSSNFFDDIGTTKHYIPISSQSTSEQTSDGNTITDFLAPCSLKVKEVMVRLPRTTTGSGDLTVGIETSNIGASEITKSIIETETVSVASSNDNDIVHFMFDDTTHATIGQNLSISIQSSADLSGSQNWYVTTIFEFDFTTRHTSGSAVQTS